MSIIEQYDITDEQQQHKSKSFRNLILKLKGSSQSREIILLQHSKRSKRSIKNHQLPLLENHDFKRYRHTLDFSNLNKGVLLDKDNSSIYCTFTSQLNHKSSNSSCINSVKSALDDDNENNENASLFLIKNKGENIISDSPHQLQKKLWQEDTLLCSKEEIAKYLGQSSPSRLKVLYLYMNNFNFSNQTLDQAFRTLCKKLYLKAESQQIDRIIEAFSKRYYICNPKTLFHCVDVIHTVAYSMLLLNTDLHIVNDWTNKMTKSAYIKNTIETIQSNVFPHLKNKIARPVSLVSLDSFLFNNTIEEEESIHSTHSGVIDAFKSNISRISHSYIYQGLTKTQRQWLKEIENTLKDIFHSIKAHCIDQAAITTNDNKKIIPQHSGVVKERRYFEGLVRRKHVMERTEKRARHRQWQLCYLVLTDTYLIMYKPNKKQAHEPIKMNHVCASVLPPPGWNHQRAHVFRFETADGGLWLFETTNSILKKTWVDACHLVAAKISKGPLSRAVCNVDYGWGAEWNTKSNDIKDVPVWYPPSPCMINSQLSLHDQYMDIDHQIQDLNKQLNEHRHLRFSVDEKSGGVDNVQALTNWDRKLRYILHELIKLGSYKDILQTQLY